MQNSILIDDRNLISKIRDRVNEFKRDGASHSWSTFQIDGIVDASMNDENAAVIVSHLDKKCILFRIKFTIRVNSGDWIIRDKFDPILKNKKRVIVSRDFKPGLLTGFDKPYYEISSPVTAAAYGIYPLNEKPDFEKLAPIKHSSLNCMA